MALNEENNKKGDAALREESVLKFWQDNKTFEKSMLKHSPKGEFVFYEGPPTANGKPGIHHLEARAFKDAIPRYKTMRGYHVRRKGGWDTHGLPVELQVEKKLGLNSKKAIEEYGIAKFNQQCKENVWEYVDLWSKFTDRIGYWVDQKDAYVTYHNNYIESVWNIIKKVDEQKLLYKDYKVVPWCPRCGTGLSSHELAQGYEDVKDVSITAKFKILGFPDAYFLAWTTTPWTLPGNIALAVGKDITYVEAKVGKEILVLAKDRLSIITEPYEIIAEHKGSEMVGMRYEPLFPYLKDLLPAGEKEKIEKAYKVYTADFVNIEDGTGIVHTAVMYGQDDFVLGNQVGLPKVHLVNPEGKFIQGTDFLEGRFVKEKDDNGKPTLDIDIVNYLTERNLFFAKENYQHSYPHCWRCHTALIYYARDSWYIRMSDPKIKQELIEQNKDINWEPAHIREGRFGEWLREIKDWAISRERYWGTPLPVWICSKCGQRHLIGSLADLKNKTKKHGNSYFVMRHGESESNARNVYSSNREINHLTENGRAQVLRTIEQLKDEKITKIYASPFLRTKETAQMVAEHIGIKKSDIIFDERIRELEFGEFSERPTTEYWDYLKDKHWDFTLKIPGGESFQETKKRLGDFLYEINQKNQNETILIVSHGLAVEVIPTIIEGADKVRSQAIVDANFQNKLASLHKEHAFVPLPHNEDYELDLHRPYIDDVVLVCDCGVEMNRTKEVMDVWFDSGAMPFAEDHYPFENKEWVDGKGYPADFISEAIDQTRGWFYTLHAVGVLMGRGKAFKNVICLGHLLDAKGKKMSKSLGNVVDPWEAMDKYGVDTLRFWMYGVNQPGESKNFDEKTVLELNRQVFGLLYNVLAFYELYRDTRLEVSTYDKKSENILDQWILAKLNELIELMTRNIDEYKLLEPTRAIREFIGDLSTWYLRRSRERIKRQISLNGIDDSDYAKMTLYFVLKTLAQIMAPFAPFTAEDIWQKLKNEKDVRVSMDSTRHDSAESSVHLTNWPEAGKFDPKIIEEMETLRKIVTLGLEARQKAGIKIRQPLSKLEIKNYGLSDSYTELIMDEINVREVKENKTLIEDVLLNIEITPELKQEGDYREFVRGVQDMRKKTGLTPSEVISLNISTNEEGHKLIEKFENDLKKVALVSKIEFSENDGEEIKIENLSFKIKIQK